MTCTRKYSSAPLLILVAVFCLFATHAGAQQTQRTRKTLVISGHAGEAAVIERNGRHYVDLERLSEMVNGTLEYQGNRIALTLPGAVTDASSAADRNSEHAFSTEFVNYSIETLGSMREWASALALALKNGFPVGDTMNDYRARAAKNFALAHAAAKTEDDRNGLQLLTTEFDNLQSWSKSLVEARNNMNAANFAMSQDALPNDPLSQKLLRCWRFLGPMFASGHFSDDGSCR